MLFSKNIHRRTIILPFYLILMITISACSKSVPQQQITTLPSEVTQPTATAIATATPPSLWLSDALPAELKSSINFSGFVQAVSEASATVVMDVSSPVDSMSPASLWVYAFVAPFPTVMDDVTSDDLRNAWGGKAEGALKNAVIWVSESTRLSFAAQWGEPSTEFVKTASKEELVSKTWDSRPAFAIVPFEELVPEWKVLKVDGHSPYDKSLDVINYPLTVAYRLKGDQAGAMTAMGDKNWVMKRNWDPEKLTTFILTGTTALVRSTAERMDTKGVLYPGEKIGDWLRNADITHVSNEVSFTPNCPAPNPEFINLQFCSAPKNIALLEDIGVDVVEMTGNHLVDYDLSALVFTLDEYHKRNWFTYGAGMNDTQALQPVEINDHGNRIAILGCNVPGPEYEWATADRPGVGKCDMEQLRSKVTDLSAAGYLVIVTLQHEESYSPTPMPWVAEDFQALIDAGAVIVSGSQAHFPQTFAIRNGHFIHYGLGNLFFDQMDYPVIGTRREFIDKHVFYDGKYIGTEILTAMLEDYAQPRPMTETERGQFLGEYFQLSGW